MAFKMESLLRHLSTVLSTCGDLRLEGIWKGNLFLVIFFIRERNPASISVRSSPVLSLAINCPSSPIHWAPSPRLPQGHQTGLCLTPPGVVTLAPGPCHPVCCRWTGALSALPSVSRMGVLFAPEQGVALIFQVPPHDWDRVGGKDGKFNSVRKKGSVRFGIYATFSHTACRLV